MSDQDEAWQNFLAQMQATAAQNTNPALVARMTALLGAQAPPPPRTGGDNGSSTRTLNHTDDDDETSSVSGRRPNAHYEKIPTDIPIAKFGYGKPGVDWREYAKRFRRAVKTVTNAETEERLDELCLLWIQLKLPDEAQSIYQGCASKDVDWESLVDELDEGFEDPLIRRNWIRDLAAYKRPAGMSLQVYKANVIGFVNKYSPAVVKDPKAYAMELYNRFVHGLEPDWREAIDDAIPFGKETIDRAYNQAIKYELKRKETKQVAFSGAAMTDRERDQMQRMRLDMAEIRTDVDSMKRASRKDKHDYQSGSKNKNFKNVKNHKSSPHHRQSGRSGNSGNRSSTSGRSGSSTNRSRSHSYSKSQDDLRAIQTADEDSDSEVIEARAKAMTETISKAIMDGMKGLSLKSRKGSSSSTASAAGKSKSRSKSKKE